MEVILVQDVNNIGKSGSVMNVKDGFARNFLFPRNLALPATGVNLKRVEQVKERTEEGHLQKKEEIENLSRRLNGVSITISAETHDEDKLYGSISAPDITSALKEEGFSIDKDSIILDEPIKTTGVYDVVVRLDPEVTATVKVWVVKR
ncbi:MAG: 50S ribosomal protein L9 [Candidatus Omnitrophota bacterium]